MANPDNKRKSTRHFNLEKPGGYHFNIEKEAVAPVASPKVTITSKPAVAPVVTGAVGESGNSGGGNNKWMWIVGAILVVAIIAWLCVRGCSSNDQGVTTEPTVEAVEATGASEEEAVVEEPATENEGEQSVSSEAEVDGPTTEEIASASTATAPEAPASAATATSASTPTIATSETVSRPSGNTVSATPAAQVSSDIEAEALKVIRGEYGTGFERKLKLGSKYREIQNRVNELKRQGAF